MSTTNNRLRNRTFTHAPMRLEHDGELILVPIRKAVVATVVASLQSGSWASREVTIHRHRDSAGRTQGEPDAVIAPGGSIRGTTLTDLEDLSFLVIGVRGIGEPGELRIDVLIAERDPTAGSTPN